MREELAKPDRAVAVLAAQQHGVVSQRQLLASGLSSSGISRRVVSGRLHRLHRGVYAVGHRGVSMEGRWMAAVLAHGRGTVLSHLSAAALWGLLRQEGPIEVSTAAWSGRSRRPGIRLHRSTTLKEGVVTQRRGIPVTTPARTIEDLPASVSSQMVRRATRQAEIAKLPLGPAVRSDGTRSDLERDFLRLCRRNALPVPEVNVEIGRWTVDFLWREERVAVETDFYGYHRGRVAFQDDHARDLDLRRRGFAVHRFSETQVNDQPAEVVADLRDALALSS